MTDAPTWWFDRCLGRALPDAMEALGVQVKRYADLYPDDPTIADIVWIPRVTALGWVIVTKDKNIRKDATERAALRRVGARYVCLAAANLSGQKQIDTFQSHWRTIDGVIRTRKAPILVSITVADVSWLDGEQWRPVKRKPPRVP